MDVVEDLVQRMEETPNSNAQIPRKDQGSSHQADEQHTQAFLLSLEA